MSHAQATKSLVDAFRSGKSPMQAFAVLVAAGLTPAQIKKAVLAAQLIV